MTAKVVIQFPNDTYDTYTIRNVVQTYFEDGFYVVKCNDGALYRYAMQLIIHISELK